MPWSNKNNAHISEKRIVTVINSLLKNYMLLLLINQKCKSYSDNGSLKQYNPSLLVMLSWTQLLQNIPHSVHILWPRSHQCWPLWLTSLAKLIFKTIHYTNVYIPSCSATLFSQILHSTHWLIYNGITAFYLNLEVMFFLTFLFLFGLGASKSVCAFDTIDTFGWDILSYMCKL